MVHSLFRVLHGALVGALLVGAAGFIESICVLRSYPYHRDPALWSQVMALYLGAGAALGAGAGLALPFLCRRQDRELHPGLFLGLIVAVGGAALQQLFVLHTVRLPGVAVLSLPGAIYTGLYLGAAALAYLALSWLARRSVGWLVSSWFTPGAAALGAGLLVAAGLAARLLPVQPAPLGVASGRPAPPEAPNVLLVVLDTTAASHSSVYGYYRPTMPELDSVASEGVVFENAFAAAPWTLPSHASLFTGLHLSTHKAGWERLRLADGQAQIEGMTLEDFHTLAEEMGRRGYDTCCIAEKNPITYPSGLTQGFAKVWDYTLPDAPERMFLAALRRKVGSRLRPPAPPADMGAQRVIDTSIGWLAGGRGRDASRPFFLFVNLNEAHEPYTPPDGWAGRFLPDGVTLEMARALDQSYTYMREFECGTRGFEPHEPEILKALYDAEILYQDHQLSRLFQALRDLELMERTLVIVTSDHGQEFGVLGRLGHQSSVVDELLRVPLVFRYPALLPAGTRVSAMASLVDIYPTILDFVERATGVPAARGPDVEALEGVSLLPLLLDPKAPPRRDFVISEYDNPMPYLKNYPCWQPEDPGGFPLLGWARSIQTLRTGTEKLVRYENGERRLFDLRQNPQEIPGAPGDVQDPQRMQPLEARLDEQLTAYKRRRLMLLDPVQRKRAAEKGRPLSPAAQLEQIGYLGSGAEEGAPARSGAVVPPPFLQPR